MQEVTAGKNTLHNGTAWRREPTRHTCEYGSGGLTEQEETQREVGQVTVGARRALNKTTATRASGAVRQPQTRLCTTIIFSRCSAQQDALSNLRLHLELENGAL